MSESLFIQISDDKGPLSGHVFHAPCWEVIEDALPEVLGDLPEGLTFEVVESEDEIITRPTPPESQP